MGNNNQPDTQEAFVPEFKLTSKSKLHDALTKDLREEPMSATKVREAMTILEEMTDGVFEIQAGSLFPALYRLVGDGRIEGDWGVSDNNRKAKFYKLTGSGRKKLEEETRNWRRVSLAIDRLLAC